MLHPFIVPSVPLGFNHLYGYMLCSTKTLSMCWMCNVIGFCHCECSLPMKQIDSCARTLPHINYRIYLRVTLSNGGMNVNWFFKIKGIMNGGHKWISSEDYKWFLVTLISCSNCRVGGLLLIIAHEAAVARLLSKLTGIRWHQLFLRADARTSTYAAYRKLDWSALPVTTLIWMLTTIRWHGLLSPV